MKTLSRQKFLVVFFTFLLILPVRAVKADEAVETLPVRYVSYRDVPGVTESEIDAIEKLKEPKSAGFTFGMSVSTESFKGTDGQMRGFTSLLCDWMSEMFGVPFTLKIYEWSALLAAMETGEVAFTGELTASDERRKTYVMTGPIAERMNTFFRLNTSRPVTEINEKGTLRLGFLDGSLTQDTFNTSGRYSFTPFFYGSHEQALQALRSGEIDAFADESVALAAFDELTSSVLSEEIFPPSYSSVSLSTRDKSLSPIISVMQKILDNGGQEMLTNMYNDGYSEYQKYEFRSSLTNNERDYINGQGNITVAAQYNDYPVSFFNEHDMEWQGIAFDVMKELTAITDLRFRVVNQMGDTLPALGRYVNGGVADILTGVSPDDINSMGLTASDKAISTDTYAFLSGTETDNVRLNEALHMKVGLVRGTSQEELFEQWFLVYGYATSYATRDDAYNALVNHEVELVLSGRNRLTYLTNYMEEVDHKVNLPLDYPLDSFFAFSDKEPEIRAVINKALQFVDTDAISDDWVRRTYDYKVKAEQKTQTLILAGGGAGVLILTIVITLVISGRQKKRLKQQVEIRTEELALQTTMMTSILECMPDMVFCKDTEMRYTRVNKSFEKFFGVSEKDLLGLTSEAFYKDAELVDIAEKNARRAVEKRQVVTTEETHINTFGNAHIFDAVRTPLVSNNKVMGVLGILHNVTRRKAIEREALEASQAKSAFLANMSHEIRTPMNSIVGFSELAMDEQLSPKAKDYISKIIENSDWLLQIINDILDISKIESGKMDLESIPFDLHEVFSRCQNMIMPKALEKGIQLYCYAEPSVGRRLLGDPTRLKQAFINILSNAVKFTNVGMVKMSSDIIGTTEDTVTVYFEVKDSGIGMTEEQAAKIFDPFTQADSSTTRKYGGTGLGLAITKNIVELMGSKLELSSIPNVGTKFSFKVTFKTVAVDAKEAGADIILNEQKVPTFDGTVLLCEDNNMNQQVIVEHLRRVGLKTVVADNGKTGLDFITERLEKGMPPFDLIFMDIHMPVMDGIEASSAISKLNIGTPIVALTANIMTNETDIYRQNGMSDYLGKPFKSPELWRCLLKYLKQAEPEETADEDDGIMKKMRLIFVQDNRNRYMEIVEAIGTGDLKLAHRIAHTLKGNAGMLDEKYLQEAAKTVEFALKEGHNNTTRQQMETLRVELEKVLHKLIPLLDGYAEPEEEEEPEPSAQETGVKSVLVVDDERANILALSNILRADYTVHTAHNGKDAINKARDLKPSVILLDVLMPDMDGYEVMSRLRDMQETKNIPVIFVTGLSDAVDEERGLALGAADYIPKPFSPAIVRLRVQIQMQILDQMSTIEQLSLLDQLTSIPNRRSFDARFHTEWVRAARDQTAMGIMIIDIDNFKNHNDTYGHQQGDRALQYVANTISGTLKRAGDFAARWGGEEFVVLLPNTDSEGAGNVAEKIRANIASTDILLADGGITHVTVSIGLSITKPQTGDSTEEFVTNADNALYEAKRTGKNRVCVG